MPLSSERHMLSLAFVLLVGMISTTLPTPLYPLYQSAFGFGLLTSTVVFASYGTGVLLTLLLMGNLSDQLGRRPVMIIGLACAVASAAIFLLANGLGMLLFARFLSGMSAGLLTATATAYIVELAPPRWQRSAALASTLANMLGLGLGPVLAGTVSTYLPGPLSMTYVVDILLLLACVMLVVNAPETRPRAGSVTLQLRRPYVPPEIRGVFVPAAIAGFAGFSVMGLFNAAVPGVLIHLMDIQDRTAIGLTIFLLFVGSSFGQATQHLLPAGQRLTLGCLLLAVGAVLIGISLYQALYVLLVMGALVAGTGQGVAFRAGLGAITQESPAEHRAAAAAMFFIIVYIAISLPVVGLGLAAQTLGLPTAGALFSGIVAVLAIAALLAILRVRRDQ